MNVYGGIVISVHRMSLITLLGAVTTLLHYYFAKFAPHTHGKKGRARRDHQAFFKLTPGGGGLS